MSEKRFKGYAEKTGRHHELIIIDSLGEEYSITDDFFKSQDVIFDIVDLLNVMNDTLLKQADENHKLSNKNIEQQATIRKLQDLCGESDGENAKLRIENKKLKAKLKEKEEDEQLYANEILELRKTNEEWLQFKDLGGDY